MMQKRNNSWAFLGASSTITDYNPAYSLERAAHMHPERISIHYGENSYRVAEANLLTRRLAELLREKGLQAGERLCFLAANSPYHMFLHLACARLGAVFVPISPRASQRELRIMWKSVQARFLCAAGEESELQEWEIAWGKYVQEMTAKSVPAEFTSSVASTSAAAVSPEAPPFPQLLSIAEISAAAAKYPGKLRSILVSETENFLLESPRAAFNHYPYPEGAAVIIFTSGSAGIPKAVELSHKQLWWAAQNFRAGFEYSTADIELVTAPLTHIGGFNGTTLDLFSHGGTVVIVKEFSAAEVLKQLEFHKVNMMFGVPTMYRALLQHPDFPATDLSRLRLPLIGGAPASPSLLNKLRAAGLEMLNVWGMTETGGAGCYLAPEHLAVAAGAIGQPFPYMEAYVADLDSGEEAQRGELWLRGPNVIQKYEQIPEMAQAVIDEAGWLHTGDLVRLDSKGFLWVEGRLHNLINTGGEKVSPVEVEAVVENYPGVRECAVVGIPDDTWGEKIALVLVMEEKVPIPELRDIQEFAARFLARHKLPRQLALVAEMPRGGNGKVDYRALAALFPVEVENQTE